MKKTRIFSTFIGLAAGLTILTGCGDGGVESKPPEPLAVSAAPTTLEEAYAGSSGELRMMSDEAVRLLRVEDYPRALVILQNLAARTDLTDSQRQLTSQALLTANQKVAEAAEQGNKDAKKLQQYREFTK